MPSAIYIYIYKYFKVWNSGSRMYILHVLITYVVKLTVGLRVDDSSEVEGLDISSHGETNG